MLLQDADVVARGTADADVANSPLLAGRLLHDLGAFALKPLEGAVEIGGGGRRSYVLGELLTNGTSIAAALAAYETAWRPVIVRKQAAGRRGANWFLPLNRLQLSLRRPLMRAARLPMVTRLVATAVAGGHDIPLGRDRPPRQAGSVRMGTGHQRSESARQGG